MAMRPATPAELEAWALRRIRSLTHSEDLLVKRIRARDGILQDLLNVLRDVRGQRKGIRDMVAHMKWGEMK